MLYFVVFPHLTEFNDMVFILHIVIKYFDMYKSDSVFNLFVSLEESFVCFKGKKTNDQNSIFYIIQIFYRINVIGVQ